MKITFTLKHLALLIAFVFVGANSFMKAQTVVPVGAASTYKTIQTAYDAIKNAAVTTAITGAYVLELQTDYDPAAGTTLETFPITLNAINGASATNTITIRPETGAKITLAYPNQTVVATNVSCATNSSATIDITLTTVSNDVSVLSTSSYVAGQGTPNNPFKLLAGVNAGTKTLTLAAGTITTARSGATLFFGPQQTKTINFDGAKYVTIDGISRTDGTTGLTISNPNCIYSQTIYFMNNAQYNTIRNCIIRGANQTGTNAGASWDGTIFFNGGSYNTITLNDVCDLNDGITPMPVCAFQLAGKHVNSAITGDDYDNTISENNIYNIENYWAPSQASYGFFSIAGGDALSKNNKILNNKMYWTRDANFATGTTIAAVGTSSGSAGLNNKFEGNTIGYTSADGDGTAKLYATGATFKGFSGLKNYTCKNNKIANIEMTGASFTGIEFGTSNASTAADDYCYGNTIDNIKLILTAAGTLSGIMVNVSNNNNSNIKNNIVRNLTAESATAATVCTVVGINVTGTANSNAYNYSGNQIYNLTAGKTTATASTAANVAIGLSIGANARTVEKNIIYNIAALNNTTTAVVTGIQTAGSNATGTVLQNNIVRLGTDVANDAIIYGINQGTVTTNTHILKSYHNSVFIGGTAPASPTKNTFAFYSSGATAVTGTNDVKNNIFANQRTITSATAKHYAIGYGTASVIKTCDYNLYWASPVGSAAGVDKTLSEWQTLLAAGSALSFSADPSFVDATGTTPNLKLNSLSSDANAKGDNLASTVADDYLGYLRSEYTPHDMGAYAYADNSAYPTLDVTTPVTAITTTTASSGGNVTLDGGSSVMARGVCWNTTAIPTIANNPTANGSGTGSFTSSITGLTANTVYNLRSYATNGTGTAYSPNITFTTLPGTPTSPTTTVPTTATTFKANWTAPTQGTASFTYVLEYSTVADLSSGVNTVAAITATNTTISGLTPSTTYYYRIKAVNASGSGAYSAIQSGTTLAATVVNITGAATETGLTNINIVNVQNGGTLTINNSITVYALNIDGGGAVNLIDTKTLTVTNLTINSDATNGIGTFKDANAGGGLTVNGTTTVNQNLASYRSWYMSSPVAGAQPTGMNRIFYYNEANNTWPAIYNSGVTLGQTAVPYVGNSFDTGKGYIVVPDNGDNNIQFIGTGNGKLNAGVKTITLKKTTNATKTGFNLIGNPYPSYLDWSLVYANAANAAVLSDATMWYRTKEETSPGVFEYKFWTVTGAGVGSPSGATKDIPPMQAFWVRTNANNSTLTLTKDMRAHAPASNKMLKAPAAKNNEMSLVRLQVSNGANTDEAVIYFSANASNVRDAYDAPKMSNGNAAIPEIYTTIGTEHIVINGMNTIPLNQEIAMGFVAGNATKFSLKANEVSNLPADVKVMLKDNVTKAETDITDGVSTYQFTPLATTDNRFSVIFRSTGATTDIDNQVDNKLLVYSNNKQITVVSNDTRNIGATLSVYNAVGQKLLNKQLAGTVTIIDGNFEAGVYMVTLNNITKKVIVK